MLRRILFQGINEFCFFLCNPYIYLVCLCRRMKGLRRTEMSAEKHRSLLHFSLGNRLSKLNLNSLEEKFAVSYGTCEDSRDWKF